MWDRSQKIYSTAVHWPLKAYCCVCAEQRQKLVCLAPVCQFWLPLMTLLIFLTTSPGKARSEHDSKANLVLSPSTSCLSSKNTGNCAVETFVATSPCNKPASRYPYSELSTQCQHYKCTSKEKPLSLCNVPLYILHPLETVDESESTFTCAFNVFWHSDKLFKNLCFHS